MPRETSDARRARARKILDALQRAYPDAKIALDFQTPLQLLVATILSAQCTDERVNMVTPGLFRTYPTAQALAKAKPAKLEQEIRSTGFFRSKARSLLGMAQGLVERHGGEVPREREALIELPGVGLKTANVVLGNAFGVDALAVDTHVFRVSQRLGLAKSEDPNEIHDQVVDIYLPLSRLLSLHIGASQALHGATATFLGSRAAKVPFVIGLAGSVAVGKSTTARIMRALLARWPGHPTVDLVATDGFLHPRRVLEARGILQRKGFPESY